MTRSARAAAAATFATFALAVTVVPADAAALKGDYFVVDTQFIQGRASLIVESGGAFAGCTQVVDLSGGGEQVGPNKVYFFGDKEVVCPEGNVVLHYVVKLNGSGKRTSGYWYVVESDNPSISEGFGSLDGDGTRCTPLPEAEGCILDTFAGEVS